MTKKIIFLFLLFLTIYFTQIKSFSIGIDFGTEFIKIVVIRPGKPFSIVENIQSKRKTPLAVSLKDEERVFGSDALNKKVRNPQNVFVYAHDFLSKHISDPELKQLFSDYFLSYVIEEDKERGSFQFKIKYSNKDFRFYPEEVVGMILRYVKFLSDKFTQADIKECVITVPNFYSLKERQAIYQSAQIAGLSVLGLVNENVGAAVQYALERRFNKTENIIFYNMGSSYTQVSLVNFNTLSRNQSSTKTVEYNEIKVLSESWDRKLGGRNFDYNIIRHMMKLFDDLPQRKGKNSVSKNPKISEKMLQTAIQVKEILSANKEAVVQVLTVEDNLNLYTKMAKETFEKISNSEFGRVFSPISQVLKNSNFTIDDIDQIEIIGGSVRIPKLQEILRENVGATKIGTHMNGDEAVAFGTAFIAANFSSNFRARKMNLYHGTNYELNVRLSTTLKNFSKFCDHDYQGYAVDCMRNLKKETTIFKVRNGLDISRLVTFKHDSDFDVDVYEKLDNSENDSLILKYKVSRINSSIQKALTKENVTPKNSKINLKFKLDRNGLLDLKAELVYNITLYYAMIKNSDGTVKFDYFQNKTEPLTDEQMTEVINLEPSKKLNDTMITIMKKKVGEVMQKEKKVQLLVEKEDVYPLPLNATQIKDAKAKLDSLDNHDKVRIQIMERRNYLESFLFDKKDWLESKEVVTHSKKSERDKFTSLLKQTKDWFEEEGYTADLSSLKNKIKDLTSPYNIISNRIDKIKKYIKAKEKFTVEMDKALKNAKNLIVTKPWTKDYYSANFTPLYESTKKWFMETKKKQDSLLANEDPVFSAEVLETKMTKVITEYKVMSNIPKPKLAETSKNNTTNTKGNEGKSTANTKGNQGKSSTNTKGNQGKSTTNTKKNEENNGKTDFSKEEVNRLINNAKDIDDLKELIKNYQSTKTIGEVQPQDSSSSNTVNEEVKEEI